MGSFLPFQDIFGTGLLNCANNVFFSPIFELLVCFSFCTVGGFMSHRRYVAELGNESRYLKLS